MSAIELLEQMARLSERMLTGAEHGDWEGIVQLEREVATLRAQLIALEPVGIPLPRMSAADARRRAKLIRQILECNDGVRAEVSPMLESTRRLLSSGQRTRDVRAAYASQMP
jgi:hypothetical protein